MLDDNLPINLAAIYKLYHYIQKRYGYPDIQILATLKQKFWIFDDAYSRSRVNFDFKGCHLLS